MCVVYGMLPKSVVKLEVQSRAPSPNSSSKGVITGTGKVLNNQSENQNLVKRVQKYSSYHLVNLLGFYHRAVVIRNQTKHINLKDRQNENKNTIGDTDTQSLIYITNQPLESCIALPRLVYQ